MGKGPCFKDFQDFRDFRSFQLFQGVRNFHGFQVYLVSQDFQNPRADPDILDMSDI